VVGTTVVDLIRRDGKMFPDVEAAITGAVPPPLDGLVAFVFGPHGWVFYLIGVLGALALVSLVFRVGLGWSRPTR